MLESYIKQRLQTKDILLMTHIVIGYPSFKESMQVVEQMVDAGVDMMELQIPFSEPMADGPVILKANQDALKKGARVNNCFKFAEDVVKKFKIPFLFMSYYNILFKYGVEKFAGKMVETGLKGAIVPDLPPEEGEDYAISMEKNHLSPIYIISPTTCDQRMTYLASKGSGFIYCVARKGVTGGQTEFSGGLEDYLKKCRRAVNLPLAVGFGVKNRADVEYLTGRADIAVIGSETIRIVNRDGSGAVGEFLKNLR